MLLKKMLIIFSFFLSGCSICRTPDPRDNKDYTFTDYSNINEFEYKEVIAKYAPTLKQSTLDESKKDFITDFDYDSDGKTNTNRDNKNNNYDLMATIYYSIVETSTHYFITYLLYHIEDGWSGGPGFWNFLVKGITYPFGGQHENDGENIQIVVDKKDGEAQDIVIMAWQHHNGTGFCVNREKLKVDGFDDCPDAPIFYLEPGKHAIYTDMNQFSSWIFNEDEYGTIDFTPKPISNGVLPEIGDKWLPNNISRKYKYGFKSIKVHLWDEYQDQQKLGDGGIMDGAFDVDLEKDLKKMTYKSLPRFFDSDEYSVTLIKKDAGIMPFYFGGGELFFDPARYYKKKFHLYKPPHYGKEKWSTDYKYNPYLPDYFRTID